MKTHRGRKVQHHAFLTSALVRGGWSASSTWKDQQWVPGSGWRRWRREKFPARAGNQTSVIQPIAQVLHWLSYSCFMEGGDWKFFSSPPRPDRPWGPPSLLSNGYHGLFPWVNSAGAWSWPLTSI